MFKSHFNESTQVSSSYPGKILLPDDNCEAMCTILSILHHCYTDVPQASFPGPVGKSRATHLSILVGNVAKLVDKYDCRAAIAPWASMLVMVLARSEGIYTGDVLYAACKFDVPEAFERLTRHLMYSPGKRGVFDGAFSNESRIDTTDLPKRLASTLWRFPKHGISTC